MLTIHFIKLTLTNYFVNILQRVGIYSLVGKTDLQRGKESYSVEIAEYATIKGLAQAPAFAWLVNYVLRKKHTIISKIKSLYW